MFLRTYGLNYSTHELLKMNLTDQVKITGESIKGELSFRHHLFNGFASQLHLTNYSDVKNARRIKCSGADIRPDDPFNSDSPESKEKHLSLSGVFRGLHFIGDTTTPPGKPAVLGFLYHRREDYAYGLSITGTTIVTTKDRLVFTGLRTDHDR